MKKRMDAIMIAPCGMNCGLCLGHQRDKNQCLGCRIDAPNKRKSCTQCSIVKCDNRKGNQMDYCYVCESYPCKRLKNLDKRYQEKYNMSMLENLEYIKNRGIDMFVVNEKKRWKCDTCDNIICVHRGYCMVCNDAKG